MMPPHALTPGLHQTLETLPPFERLYDRYHVQVYRYLYIHLGNEHDAADVMQQVFLQVWKQGQTYDPKRGTVATWLLSIGAEFGSSTYRPDFGPLQRLRAFR